MHSLPQPIPQFGNHLIGTPESHPPRCCVLHKLAKLATWSTNAYQRPTVPTI
jgi:hypothetical protein